MNAEALRDKAKRLRATADSIDKAAAFSDSGPQRRAEEAEAEGYRNQANQLDIQASQLEANEGL